MRLTRYVHHLAAIIVQFLNIHSHIFLLQPRIFIYLKGISMLQWKRKVVWQVKVRRGQRSEVTDVVWILRVDEVQHIEIMGLDYCVKAVATVWGPYLARSYIIASIWNEVLSLCRKCTLYFIYLTRTYPLLYIWTLSQTKLELVLLDFPHFTNYPLFVETGDASKDWLGIRGDDPDGTYQRILPIRPLFYNKTW